MGYRQGGGVQIPTLPVPANDLTSTLQQVGNILQKLNINVAPMSATPISMAPPQDQAAQLQKILDFVSGLINPSGNSQPLGQVNGALGETIGNLLDGKKTAIGAIGSLLTAWLSSVPALAPGTTPSGLLRTHPTDSRVRSRPQRLYHAVIPCPDGLGCTRQAREMGPGHRTPAYKHKIAGLG